MSCDGRHTIRCDTPQSAVTTSWHINPYDEGDGTSPWDILLSLTAIFFLSGVAIS
jgi:hypothetical protein